MSIPVVVGDIEALLIGGSWVKVNDVTVDFAEYLGPMGERTGRGLHVAATFQGGPNNGDTLVVPLDRVDGLRYS